MTKRRRKPRKTVTGKRALLYVRFSPRPNAAECESCERQLEDLRAWAVANGYEIDGEFRDEALSGGDDWEDRPGMMELAVAACRGHTVLVRSYDRFFRDARKALVFCADLEARGVTVVSITEPAANGDDPLAALVRTIMLALAEYQRAITRARTKVKMLQHQRNGRLMSSQPPWGMQHDPKNRRRLIPNERELEAARLVIMLRDKVGLSWPKIARALDEAGYRNRSKSKVPFDPANAQRIYNRYSVPGAFDFPAGPSDPGVTGKS